VKHPLPVALAGVSVVMCLAAALAGQLGVAQYSHLVHFRARRRLPAAAAAPPAERPLPRSMVGVAAQAVKVWDGQTRVDASLSVSYISMAKPVPAAFMRWAEIKADGARPIIEILPHGHSLQSITRGRMDGWFRALKAEINEPVVISFGPEANGTWYTWAGHPAQFRTAWRHVWHVLGRRDITWLWQMSSRRPLTGYWPGQHYVTWAGVDGYLERPSDTFSNRFGEALAAVRTITRAPIVVSETAVGPRTGHQAAGIRNLFAGARRRHVIGVVWFDQRQSGSLAHQDWQLSPGTAAMAAFRSAAAAFLRAG